MTGKKTKTRKADQLDVPRVEFKYHQYTSWRNSDGTCGTRLDFPTGTRAKVHRGSLRFADLEDNLRELKSVRIKVDGTDEWFSCETIALKPLYE